MKARCRDVEFKAHQQCNRWRRGRDSPPVKTRACTLCCWEGHFRLCTTPRAWQGKSDVRHSDVRPLDLRSGPSWTDRTNERLQSAVLSECDGLLTGQTLPVLQSARLEAAKPIGTFFNELRSHVSRCDPRIQLSAFQNVSPWICRIHGPSWTQLPCEAVGNPAVRNGTTLGSANMNRLAHAEERRTGLKNNTTCLSPAPIQWFTTTWL
jgi:hypothetical protein